MARRCRSHEIVRLVGIAALIAAGCGSGDARAPAARADRPSGGGEPPVEAGDEAADEAAARDVVAPGAEEVAARDVVAGGDRLAVALALGTPAIAYPRAAGAHVFGWGLEGAWNSLVAFAADRSEPVRITPLGSAGIPASAEYTDAVVSGCLMTVDGEDLVAIDPVAGAARWRTPLPIPASVTRRRHPFVSTRVVRAGEVLVGFVGDSILGSWATVFALSSADGHVLWQRDGPGVPFAMAASGDRAIALLAPDLVQAIDAGSGARAWQIDAGAPWRGWERVEADRDAIVVVRERAVLVLDPATGARRARIDPSPAFVDTTTRRPALDGDAIFVVLTSAMPARADAPLEHALAAYDVGTGALRWRTPPRVSTSLHAAPLIADATSVLWCLDDEVLRAHDRATGAPISELGLAGACEDVALAPDASGERPIVARRRDERVVVRRGRAPAPAPLRVRLHGRVLDDQGRPVAGARVLAAGASAESGPDGRYELAIEARGFVVIAAYHGDADGGARFAVEDAERDHDLVVSPPGPID